MSHLNFRFCIINNHIHWQLYFLWIIFSTIHVCCFAIFNFYMYISHVTQPVSNSYVISDHYDIRVEPLRDVRTCLNMHRNPGKGYVFNNYYEVEMYSVGKLIIKWPKCVCNQSMIQLGKKTWIKNKHNDFCFFIKYHFISNSGAFVSQLEGKWINKHTGTFFW